MKLLKRKNKNSVMHNRKTFNMPVFTVIQRNPNVLTLTEQPAHPTHIYSIEHLSFSALHYTKKNELLDQSLFQALDT